MMRRYKEMSDSKIPWIGDIPQHWLILRMKNIFESVSEKNHPDAEVLSLYRELGVLPKNSRDDNHNVTSEDTASYKFVRINDLVINKMKAWQGSLAISGYEGIVSPAYYVCRFKKEDLCQKYFHYLLRTKMYAQEFERLSTGMRVGQWDLGIDDFMRVPVVVPPVGEQNSIAEHLDEICTLIDSLIEETKVSIQEYSSWMSSIIEEAVTNGISGERCKKHVDLEWIDSIPDTWETSRLKRLFSIGKGLPITKDNLVETGIAVISYGQIHAKVNSGTTIKDELIRYVPELYMDTNPESLVNEGDILIADTSEDKDGCGNCVYVDRNMKLFAGYHTIILRSTEKRNNKYLAYLFKSDAWRSQIRTRVSGVKLFSITKKILNDVSLIVPPEKEQNEIVDYLDDKCEKIKKVIAQKNSLIEDLEIFKHSYIFEVVTGKRKVV